jgi:hypothetical protein
MRYVAGSDLSKRLVREGRLAPVEAAALIAQVGNGLDAIHAAGLVHRDVKPANVLLSGEAGSEHAYITDFGVARNVATESGLTQTGRFVGTLDYVAPEQISGAAVDARVDVYALGCLLFKLLTGEVPFPREGEAARLYAHLNDPPPAPSLYVPEVSMALDDVVIRAMSKQPEDRHPSAGDLGRAAVAAVSGAPVSVPERTVATGAAATREAATRGSASGVTEPLAADSKPPRRGGGNRRLLFGGGLLAAVAIVVAVVALGGSGGGDGESGDATATTAKQRTPPQRVKKPAPQTLTRAGLIKKADQICAESRTTYTGYLEEFPNGRYETGVGFSRLLAGISSKAVRRFNELKPPPSLQEKYVAYVAAQEEVAKWDRDALKAAMAGDEAAERAAREDNFNSEDDRRAMAEAIGFHECSGSEI